MTAKQDEPDDASAALDAKVDACLSHAEDLLRAAKRVLADEHLPNVAYHLGVLSLEEVGKASLMSISQMGQLRSEVVTWAEKRFENHLAKLFWAIWTPSFLGERVTQDQIETSRSFARNIHENRLRGLYVSADTEDMLLPSQAISIDQVEHLIGLTEARIGLERAREPGPSKPDSNDDLKWFLEATVDDEKARLIFGTKSLDKLAELGIVREWVTWLRAQFHEAEVAGQASLERELKRQRPGADEASEEKWRLRIRFVSGSHSIRPGLLSGWNKQSTWIRFFPVAKKKDKARRQ